MVFRNLGTGYIIILNHAITALYVHIQRQMVKENTPINIYELTQFFSSLILEMQDIIS